MTHSVDHSKEVSEAVTARFRLQRQKIAVQSAGRLYVLGNTIFFLFLLPSWLQGNFASAYTIEFLAMLAGGIGVWTSGGEKALRGVLAIVISFGLACFFALLQFGPNLGVGVMLLAWMIAITTLLDRGYLATLLAMAAVASVGFADLQGLTGDWKIHFDALDWVRTTCTVGVISLAVAIVVHRMNRELVDAWHRESIAEAERSDTERALLQSQRLESIGKLAGGVAHDFNNALAVLVGGIDALANAPTEADRMLLLRNMEQAARGAVATTRQLLSLSRQGHEPGQPAHPREALEALVPNLVRLFPETIEIHSELADTSKVPLSSGSLEQVVLNLGLNARDAMPDGGRLEINCRQLNDQVIIVVTDTGMGMDESILEKATGTFFTTKRTGTGLGLPMVMETVQSVDGKVEIDSVPGVGTTITLKLPAILPGEEAALTETATPDTRSPRADGPRTVLLVEDNAMVREMYTEVLRQADFEVTAVENVADALTTLDENEFAILVTDAVLPDGEPSRAIKQFREIGGKPVLVVSGYIDSDELIQDLGQGDYEFLQKPFPNEQLIDTVHALLGGREPSE